MHMDDSVPFQLTQLVLSSIYSACCFQLLGWSELSLVVPSWDSLQQDISGSKLPCVLQLNSFLLLVRSFLGWHWCLKVAPHSCFQLAAGGHSNLVKYLKCVHLKYVKWLVQTSKHTRIHVQCSPTSMEITQACLNHYNSSSPLQNVKKYFSDGEAQAKLDALGSIRFESSEITLDIPGEEILLEGWKITPLTSPVVSIIWWGRAWTSACVYMFAYFSVK